MSVDEIKLATERLSLSERQQLERLLHGWEDDEWDQQIARDATSGRLGKLLAEVDDDIDNDRLHNSPHL